MGKKISLRKLYWFGVPVGLLLMGSGYATTFHSSTMSGPYPLTQKRIQYIDSHVGAIYNDFGVFYRTTNIEKLPDNEIAHGLNNANIHTEEIITKFGVFVKKPE